MKKLFIAILCVLMVLPAGIYALAAGTYYAPDKNIAANKSYIASQAYTATPPAMGYQDINGKELTDGAKGGNDLYATVWHGFDYRKESPMYATIDLGAKTEGLIYFNMEFVGTENSGIAPPQKVEYLISDDGVSFTSIGTAKVKKNDGYSDFFLKLTEPVSARYIKASVGKGTGGVFVFCSEFEVYNSTVKTGEDPFLSGGTDESSEPEESVGVVDKEYTEADEIIFTAGSRFFIEEGFIKGFRTGDTLLDFLRELKTTACLTVKNKNGKALGQSDPIGTGCTVSRNLNGKSVYSYQTVLTGDTNGDGTVNASDYISARTHILGIKPLAAAFLEALDSNYDKSISAGDYIAVRRAVLGSLDLYKEYVSENIGENMKFIQNSDKLYTLTSTAENGKTLTLTFDKKEWGTWNIGTLTCGGTVLAGSGTDWEYVFRASDNSTASKWVWSGGNHGNEVFKDIKFYDAVTGNELAIEKGKQIDVGILKIVETTRLNWGDADTSYCDVTRTYTVAGQRISLAVDYSFTRDSYFCLSYTCMFPVPKTVGLYVQFNNEDGTKKTVVTSKVGKADYSGPMYKGNSALSALIYGYKNTEYSFLVEVLTKKDSVDNFNSAFKTAYWDMNTTFNKLYFGKFDDNKKTKVPAGSSWHTESTWTLLVGDGK